jgi:hypothetical protein
MGIHPSAVVHPSPELRPADDAGGTAGQPISLRRRTL